MTGSDNLKASTASRATGAPRMVGLDSLRGVAILSVIAFHVGNRCPPGGLLGSAVALGYAGVQLFFIVSAISMCYVWDQRPDERHRVLGFLIRRLCRIAPPFWFGIVFYMLWRQFGFLPGSPAGPIDVALTATFLHGFFPSTINLVVPGGWSIAVEVGFYVLFPLLALRLGGIRGRLVGAFVCYLCTTAVASAIHAKVGMSIDLFLYYCLLTQLPVFLVGMAVYSVAVRREPLPRVTALVVWLCWVAAASAFRGTDWLGRAGMWWEVGLMAVAAAIVIGRFESRFLAFAGRLSYSAYLVHFAIIDLVALLVPHGQRAGPLTFAGMLGATCAGTCVIAWASSKTLEAWSIAYGRSLVRRLSDPAVKPMSAAR